MMRVRFLAINSLSKNLQVLSRRFIPLEVNTTMVMLRFAKTTDKADKQNHYLYDWFPTGQEI